MPSSANANEIVAARQESRRNKRSEVRNCIGSNRIMPIVKIVLLLSMMAWNAVGAAEEWRTLFDGKTAAGWLEITGKPFPDTWTIEDGCLKTVLKPGGMQDIRTVEVFRDFELEFEWKMKANGNSGVKYLVQKVDEWTNKDGRQARARGLEYQLADENGPDVTDASRASGSLYSVIAPVPHVVAKIGEFNRSRIVVNGERVDHWLNGTRVVSFGMGDAGVVKQLRELRKGDDLVSEGPISLQHHGTEIWFRAIRVRRITGSALPR